MCVCNCIACLWAHCGVCSHNMNTCVCIHACVCQGLKLVSVITLAHSSNLFIEAGSLSHTQFADMLSVPNQLALGILSPLSQTGITGRLLHTYSIHVGFGVLPLAWQTLYRGASFPALSWQPFSTSEQKQVPISGWQFALVSLISPLGRRDSSIWGIPQICSSSKYTSYIR